ncbi:hypothetical protein [Rhodococcus opacus]|uniref:hypothetical protein n=1 Tax=Rhodococcus opacus TaxID=37919 RepID=UPI002475930C|nr:hypothetical protein [Rhodococcus opacus]MDH6292585.1 ribosome maturation factor RimP [Rhodococcus opacus]
MPPGARIDRLDDEEQMVLSIKLDAPSSGLGLDDTTRTGQAIEAEFDTVFTRAVEKVRRLT